MIKASSLLAILMLFYVRVSGQEQSDDLYQLIGKIISDEDLKTVLYTYDHFGDGVLFMAYSDAVKNAMDTSRYTHLDSWKYHIMMEFSGNRVYLAGYGYLLAKLIKYYLQLDEIAIEENEAEIKFRTNSMDQKLKELYYLEGKIVFEKKGSDWSIVYKRIKRI